MIMVLLENLIPCPFCTCSHWSLLTAWSCLDCSFSRFCKLCKISQNRLQHIWAWFQLLKFADNSWKTVWPNGWGTRLVPYPLGHTVFKGFHLSSLLAKLISYQRVLQWAPRKDDLFSFLATFSFHVLLFAWQLRAVPRHFFLLQKCTCQQQMYSWYLRQMDPPLPSLPWMLFL